MSLDLAILGGGMIVHDQILPSVYHLQRDGRVGAITIAATQTARLRDLVSERFAAAFPGQSFRALPALTEPADRRFPDLWKQAVRQLKPRQMVIVATPDELHGDMVKFALEHDQHVLCVKPLVHRCEQAMKLMNLAHARGLYVGIEYHKRFDRRSLEARGSYRAGRFGRFRCGDARLIEPWSYRCSNFQNWFTKDKTDPFTYIGCHYVDLVYFITGLRPVEVSVQGVEGAFPNGNVAYMWSAGRVVFEGGGILSVINGLGYPDGGAGSNDQGMRLFCEGARQGEADLREGEAPAEPQITTGARESLRLGGSLTHPTAGGLIHHSDQYRGVSHCYLSRSGEAGGFAGKHFHFINPDYFRLVPYDGPGLRPVGYGHDSIEAHLAAAAKIEAPCSGLAAAAALPRRQQMLRDIDERGILATPANSNINELVVEAARWSIARDGAPASIRYEPQPHVLPRAS